jgi:site-specific DNA-methyltransferase (adenine-specific)
MVFDDGRVALYCGDCREILPTLEPAHVVIADPPYGDTSLPWDRIISGWLDAAVLAPGGSVWCFGSMRSLLKTADQWKAWKLAQDLVWRKHNGSSFHADRFRRVHEHLVHYYQGAWSSVYRQPVTTADAAKRQVRRKRRPPHMGHIEAGSYASEDGGPRLQRSVIDVRSCHGYAIHPTQKPLGILEPLIEYSCPPDGLVVDPFAGGASSLLAARRLGRRAIGIEIDPAMCARAAERLSAPELDLAA